MSEKLANTSQMVNTSAKKPATKIKPTKKITSNQTPTPAKKNQLSTPKKTMVSEESGDGDDEGDSEAEEEESDSKKPRKKPNKSCINKKTAVRPPKKPKSVAKKESEDEEESGDEVVLELKGGKKKRKPNHDWTKDPCFALLSFILDQVALGKGTDNGNLKGKGWMAVRKAMYDRFQIHFNDEQLKNQKGHVQKLYIDLEFLKSLSGFGWNPLTGMVTSDAEICNIQGRKFVTLCKGNITWFDLADELFVESYATGATALQPGQARPPPKRDPDEVNPLPSDLSGLSTNSIKRRRAAAKAIDIESSDDEGVEVIQRAARNPPKKQIRESKFDILKNGVESIVEVLRGQPSQPDIKPDIKPALVPEVNTALALSIRQEAIKLMASMFLGEVPISEYIQFIKVVESEANAEVFVLLASTTDPSG
ncbi:hypothetical protein PSHT_05488 [Puccinia striiformis]|uniref:Myb/SANT-like domain-containing protein n=1 Tax=Puccinia striiformis TaxID=27350 RepID=A0A2S4WA85_9BASI|nr:hypothetical protein PSHT_05488 [Puccinia striiformis]